MPPGGASVAFERGPRLPLAGSLIIRIASAAAAFGLHMLLARLAGADQYGTYSYVLACLGIAALIVTLGLDLSLVRFVAAYRARAAWRRLAGLRSWSERLVLRLACLIAAVTALALWVARHEVDPSLLRTGWIACGVLPAAALLRLNEAGLLGLKRVVLAHLPDGVVRPAATAGLAVLAVRPGRPVAGQSGGDGPSSRRRHRRRRAELRVGAAGGSTGPLQTSRFGTTSGSGSGCRSRSGPRRACGCWRPVSTSSFWARLPGWRRPASTRSRAGLRS